MSTVNGSPSLRLTHTDERYQDVKKAYHHLYMWLREGRVDEEMDRHTLWWRNGWTLRSSMMRSTATYGNESATEALEYLDGKSQIVYTLENLGIEEFLDIVFLTTGKWK